MDSAVGVLLVGSSCPQTEVKKVQSIENVSESWWNRRLSAAEICDGPVRPVVLRPYRTGRPFKLTSWVRLKGECEDRSLASDVPHRRK